MQPPGTAASFFCCLGQAFFLTIQLRALPIRRLFFALRTAFGREARYSGEKTEAGVSPFASLMTELAAEIGTGNIVGVASAMALGGPGALGMDDAGGGCGTCFEIF